MLLCIIFLLAGSFTSVIGHRKQIPVADCPRFDYEYKLLERLIKLEIAIKNGGSNKDMKKEVDELARKLQDNTANLENSILDLTDRLDNFAERSTEDRKECKEKLDRFEDMLEGLKEDIEMIKQNKTRRRYYIRLEVLAGSDNPEITIDESDPRWQELSTIFEDMASSPLADELGYRGFTIKIWTKFGWFEKTVGKLLFPFLERKLLELFSDLLEAIRRYIEEILDRAEESTTTSTTTTTQTTTPPIHFSTTSTTPTGTKTVWTDSFTSSTMTATGITQQPKYCSLPKYEPKKWNVPAVQPSNNCYNYANNKITNTFAQPGRGVGKKYKIITGKAVSNAAKKDGLVKVADPGENKLPRITECLIALVIWPNVDFHWYRLDVGGQWSHKPGGTAAKNTDNAGALILDPRKAIRGPYTEFTTFMGTHSGVTIN